MFPPQPAHGLSSPGEPSVLAVDDDPAMLEFLHDLLQAEGYSVTALEDPAQALATARRRSFDCILLDLLMPRLDGLQFMRGLNDAGIGSGVVILSAMRTDRTLHTASELGAYEYLTKPANSGSILEAVEGAIRARSLGGGAGFPPSTLEIPYPEDEPAGIDEPVYYGPTEIRSPVMRQLLSRVRLLSRYFASMLVLGGRGSGKDLLVREIVYARGGNTQRIQRVDSAFLTPAELGRRLSRPGPGVLILERLESMPPDVQQLLDSYLEKLDGSPGDLCLVATGSPDLLHVAGREEMLPALLSRISRLAFTVPRLSERPEDIPVLAGHFMRRTPSPVPLSRRRLSFLAEVALRRHPWPGNVRELESVITAATLMSNSGVIDLHDLPPRFARRGDPC